ncbi:MAG: Hsp20/alpha crystallin family protein [Thermodesulfobacteriota bacterium]|nr:Hsp20/alpha crystallin family protein [Thermodesulfobacteriota bacterium]
MTGLTPILRRRGLFGPPSRSFLHSFFEDFGMPSLLTEERGFTPAFDISETENELIVTAEIPGMDKEDIDIHLSEGVLTIKGEKRHEKEDKKEDYHCIERSYGSFTRSIGLPFDVETDKVDATYKDGVLKLTLPKSERAKLKKIEVKT